MHKIAIDPVLLERGRRNRGGKDRAFDHLDMSRVAHVVVDMQNVFVAEGAASEVPVARQIVPNINSISRAVREAGGLNVFLRMVYDPAENTPWSNWYSGLLGNPFSTDLKREMSPDDANFELWPGIDAAPDEPRVNKTRFSGFTPGTCNLDPVLKERGIDTVIISGTVTNCCSEATARDAQQLNYKVIFVTDSNAAMTDAEHNATLGSLYVAYADVLSTSEVVALVGASESAPAAV